MVIDDKPLISILVPSYGRAHLLLDCLQNLVTQECQVPFEIVGIARANDSKTLEVMERYKANCPPGRMRIALVDRSGLMAALRTGWKQARGEVVACTDDDACYPITWVQEMWECFRDPVVGAVGGPIEQEGQASANIAGSVARITWYGRAIQNTYGKPQFTTPVEVDFLCGANMAFRKEALREEEFDLHLDSPGYSPGNEIALCYKVRRRNFRVLFNPHLGIRHLSAPWAEGKRGVSLKQIEAYSRNITYIMMSSLSPAGRLAFTLYFWGIGQWSSPGIILGTLATITGRKPLRGWLGAALRGKRDGLRLARGGEGATH